MARIFLSHSSADNFEAIAVRDWLVAEGWDDIFLDIDPRGGIAAADRWERSLHEAANRCEAVVFLVSRKWLASEWCLREFNLAVRLNKRLFGVLIEDIPVAELRSEMTAWQVINLARGQDGVIRRAVMETGEEKHVTFSRAGLAKLKFGLQRAGLDPRFFEWPPKHDPDRPPYRGMKPLEADDAGIFFGREAQVIEALDRLRGLADAAPPRFLAILGASGAGKSSFMRAGLLPRLERDDRNFLTLPVIRPERGVISGDTGLVASLEEALKRAGQPKSRADIKAALAGAGATANLLADLAESARAPQLDAAERPAPPAIVIAVDQGEELSSAEGKAEAESFLTLLASLLTAGTTSVPAGNEPALAGGGAPNPSTAVPLPHRLVGERWHPSQHRGQSDAAGPDQDAAMLAGVTVRGTPSEPSATAPRIILLVTIRSDSYEALQTNPQLEGIRQSTFSLPPLAKGAFQLVIEGPSVRLRDTNRPLRIEPALTQALLADVEADTSKDALPLLAFTLERLWREHGTTGDLKLADYRTMGGVKGSIEAAVERVMKAAETDPDLRNVADRPALLRRAIIPWLATIDRETNTPRRRIARLSEIPAAAQSFIRLLVAERLLSTDQAFDRDGRRLDDVTVEPAHEALLRQWGLLQQWLDEESAAYAAIEGIQRAAGEWTSHNRDETWLAHHAGRLEDAERFAASEDFGRLLSSADRDYLAAARTADNTRRDSELARQKQLARRTRIGAAAAACLAIVAVGFAFYGLTKADEAEQQALVAALAEQRANLLHQQAEEARDLALKEKASAETAAAEAKRNETVSLAALSRVARSEGLPVEAVKLALAAWPRAGDEQRPAFRRTINSLGEAFLDFRQRLLLRGHEAAVVSVDFSPDGGRIVTASFDKTARVWDAATGTEVLALNGHADSVLSAAFSPDGTRIVTASSDKTARVWDPETGAQVMVLNGHQDVLQSADFSADGTRIVTTSSDKTARVWDAATGEPNLVLAHEALVHSAAFSPDGSRIVTASGDKTARLWDAATGAQLLSLHGHGDSVESATFSSDGTAIVTASWDGTARIWNATNGAQIMVLDGHEKSLISAAFSPDGTRIVTGSADNTSRVWDAATGRQMLVFKGHEGTVESAAFSPDGDRVVTASGDGTARVWDAAMGRQILRLSGHKDDVLAATFSPNGARLVTASWDDTARVWDTATGTQLLIFKGNSAVFSPDGKRIATSSGGNGTALVRDAETGALLLLLSQQGSNSTFSVNFSPDCKRIVTASGDNTGRVWDAETGAQVLVLSGHEDDVESAEFSPNGTRIVTASWDKSVRVWDAATGKQLLILDGHESNVWSATFSPDGMRILTGSSDKTARLWDAATGAQLLVFKGAEENISSADFSPDGARIVTGSGEKTARLWDVVTGASILALEGHDGGVWSAAFSPDGTRIVTASADGTARIWDISSLEKGDPFQIACQRLGNNTDLSDVEARYGLSKLTPICGDHPPLPVDQSKLQ